MHNCAPPLCTELSSTARYPAGPCCHAVPQLALLPSVQGCSAQVPLWEQWQDAGLQAGQLSGRCVSLAVGQLWLWGTGPRAGRAARCPQGGTGWPHALTAACCIPGETFVLGDGPPGPLEPRMDPMDSALNAVNASGHSRSSREFRLQGYRHLHQPCSLSQGSTSTLGRLGSTGRSTRGH